MSDVSAPQPGWYADPENPAGERWWNGSGWSEHKRGSTEVPPPPAVETPPPFVPAPLAEPMFSPTTTPPAAVPPVAVPPATVPPATVPPAPVAPVPAATPADAGFTFGSAAPVGSDSRPDPYAPPAQGVATPYYSSPYVGAPYGAPAYGQTMNGLALAGLITSAAAWLVIPIIGPIAGIILSAFGLRQAKIREAAGNPNSGRGLAMAGLIVGIVIAGITLLFVAFFVVGIVASYSTTFN